MIEKSSRVIERPSIKEVFALTLLSILFQVTDGLKTKSIVKSMAECYRPTLIKSVRGLRKGACHR